MKTPEQMAEEYANGTDSCDVDQEYAFAYKGFLAGYQAAKDPLADADKAMKSKAWCAWHPEQGFAVFTMSEQKNSCWPLLADSFGCSWVDDKDIEKFKVNEGKDWQVVPVVIIHDWQKKDEINSPEKLDGWISVKERLPNIGAPCLVTCHEERYTIAEYDGIKWTTLNSIAYYHPIVTHWQPLPIAPKGEG